MSKQNPAPSPSRPSARSCSRAMLLLRLYALFPLALSFAPDASLAPRAEQVPPRPSTATVTSARRDGGDDDGATSDDQGRREFLQRSLASGSVFASCLASPAPGLSSAAAAGGKSRTQGYAVQRTEKEWYDTLSPTQYFILRQGGTESPYSSVLEGEERAGAYVCAACPSPLFGAGEKLHSGTGWPSFASPVGGNVETEDVPKLQYQLAGAEVRCRTCGGHLGDVFADGFLFPGTPAFATGKRYCIDGAALVFVPEGQAGGRGELEVVRGDLPPKNRGRAPVFPG